MRPGARPALILAVVAWAHAASAGAGEHTAAEAPEPESVARGAYLVHAAGCLACHTDPKRKDEAFAGGRALATPFGTFYTPNITPDPSTGIGAWSDEDFLAALTQGVAPDGRHYYPVFPYPSYAGMRAQDVLDLKAYLFSVAPVARVNRRHEVRLPFNFRFLVGPWKMLFFEPGPFVPDPSRAADWNRGAYLVRHLGHCGECHTPRNFLGARDSMRALAGNPSGPDGKKVPNITPHPEHGIGKWRDSDITYFLKTGFLPDGDVAGGAMTEVIEQSTSHLSDDDRSAIAVYLRASPPQPRP